MPRALKVVKNPSTSEQAYGDPAIYLNIAFPVVLTADLPAAGGDMDGRACIEDAGAGNCNFVFWARGERYKVDGGSNV